jgi:hypothetical protein
MGADKRCGLVHYEIFFQTHSIFRVRQLGGIWNGCRWTNRGLFLSMQTIHYNGWGQRGTMGRGESGRWIERTCSMGAALAMNELTRQQNISMTIQSEGLGKLVLGKLPLPPPPRRHCLVWCDCNNGDGVGDNGAM